MKLVLASITAILLLASTAPAQTLDFKLDHLAAKAKEKAEVDIDPAILPAKIKEDMKKKGDNLLDSVSRVYVRHYEFEKAGAYQDSDLDNVRKQLKSDSGWSRIVSVKEEKESVEIYAMAKEGKSGGFVVMAAEPKELTVVYIQGSIDLQKVNALVNSKVLYDLSSAK